MTDQSKNSTPTTCEDLSVCTSLQGFQDGTMPSTWQDGEIDLFGQALAPANRSRPPAKDQVPLTKGTFGRIGSVSSASASLGSSLAKMLRQRLDGVGSTLFSLTWKRKVTPRGRPYFQLAASARRISGKGCGSWPSPRVSAGGAGGGAMPSWEKIQKEGDRGRLECTGASGLVAKSDGGNEPQKRESDGAQREQWTQIGRRTVVVAGVGTTSGNGLMAHANIAGYGEQWGSRILDGERTPQRDDPDGCGSPWSDLEWLPCSDGKQRPTQSTLQRMAPRVSDRMGYVRTGDKAVLSPLITGAKNRTSRLRAYGNAIVPVLAAEFILAAVEAIE